MKAPGVLLALSILFSAFSSPHAATVCSETELRSALDAGGEITFGCDTQIVLSATLQVRTDAVVDAGTNQVTISGGSAVRVFEVADGVSFTLKNISVINGYFKGADEVRSGSTLVTPAADAPAAGLAATNAILFLENCVFSNNVAFGGQAIIASISGGSLSPTGAGEAFGGAISLNGGELHVTRSTFLTNSALGGTGENESTVNTGPAGDSWGGAIYSSDALVAIDQSQFNGNSSFNGGGAIFANSNSVTIANSTFRSNEARARHNHRFAGNPESDGLGGALELRSLGMALITNSFFRANSVTGGGAWFQATTKTLAGGAIYSDSDLSIVQSDFIENFVQGLETLSPIQVSRGGAICVDSRAEILDSYFHGNQIFGADGRANTVGDGGLPGKGLGGAIFSSGELFISKSAFISNYARGGIGREFIGRPTRWAEGQGSAIYSSNRVTATNITIALNITRDGTIGALGAAVFLNSLGSPTTNDFIFSTFATNQYSSISESGSIDDPTVPLHPLHIRSSSNAFINLQATILSGGTSNTVLGNLVDAGYNITSDTLFTESTSKNSTDPQFGPLGLIGGFSGSIPVLAGGPAIDAVPASLSPATDQRGRARPYNGSADIGAYEISPPFVIAGHIRPTIDLANVILDVNGTPFEVNADTGAFLAYFSASGTLAPILSNTLFTPAEYPLTSGVEQFDLLFTGYTQNELAIESGENLLITFAVESAGDYQLESSPDLQTWTNLQFWTATANSLLQKEIAPTATPQFFQVKKL
jgi:hypothetical protein